MEELEVELILAQAPEPKAVFEGLASALGLDYNKRGMTSTFDRMLDTEDFALLAREHSLRVRQKLDNVYAGNEIRLTYKYPLRHHERLFIRAEHKLKLAEPDYGQVLMIINSINAGLGGSELHSALHVHELANEAYLGEKGARISVSLDHCTYTLPEAEDAAGPQEYVLELESHGVDEDVILQASDWVIANYGGREAAQGKYARGLRLLGKL